MVDERPITELLKKVESGERGAADVIVQHFWEVARRHAERHLSARARRLKGGSDIANAALRSALSYLKKPKAVVRSRDDFEDLVLDIVRKKSKDAGRRSSAGKRDVRREQQLSELDVLPRAGELADELAMAEELAERIEQILMREPSEKRQVISRLGD